MDYAQFQKATKGCDLPLAWLDLDALEQNMRAVLDRAGNKPVRVVTKSIRSVSLLRRILSYSPQFQGLMCFHPAEAVYLSESGLDDLLVAYPSLQSSSIAKVCEQSALGKKIILMVDDENQLDLINTYARKSSIVQPVCLDLDMSLALPALFFGVRRSPVNSPQQAVNLYRAILTRPNLKLVGVMGYEAQIAGVGDSLPGKALQNKVVPWLKRIAIPRLTRRRCATVNALRQAGAKLQFVNGGGSGSIPSTVADPSVTEVAVGSAFFSPHLFDYYRDFRYQPAAGFALEVVRQPDKNYVTCRFFRFGKIAEAISSFRPDTG